MNLTYEQLEPIIRKKISEGGKVIIEPKGTSMLPIIIQGEDKVELSPVSGQLKKYDIVFYKRRNGKFVLHRIIAVRKNDYILRGDNQIINEPGITDDMIIAVATAIIKDSKVIKTNDREFIKYSKKQVRKKTMIKMYLDVRKRIASIIKMNKAQK